MVPRKPDPSLGISQSVGVLGILGLTAHEPSGLPKSKRDGGGFERGLINNLLLDLHLISSPLQLIYSRMAVYVGIVHIMLPVMILPLVSVMMGIDKSLMAAARSMGATPLAAFWRVFFPMSLPGVRSGSLLVFVLCLGFYITPAALGGLRDAMLSNFIAAQVASSFNMASTATSAFILLGIAAVVLSIVGLDLSATRVSATRFHRVAWRRRLPSFGSLTFYLEELACPYRAKRWTARLYQARAETSWWTIVGAVFVGLVLFYLLFPSVVVVIMSFSDGTFLEFPPSGMVPVLLRRSILDRGSLDQHPNRDCSRCPLAGRRDACGLWPQP